MKNTTEIFNKLKGEKLTNFPKKETPESMATVKKVAEEFHAAGYGGIPLKEVVVLDLLPDPDNTEYSVGYVIVGSTNFNELKYSFNDNEWVYLLESPIPGLIPNRFLKSEDIDPSDWDTDFTPFTEDSIIFTMDQFIFIDAIAGWRNNYIESEKKVLEFINEQQEYFKMYISDAQRVKDGKEPIGPDIEQWAKIWAEEQK